ncbi:MAG: phage tail sheath subtilisin-like domain-containing protein, partial [Oscillospiraceae bacterium]|nr:phage tail sheath subtilisin-like domain-containing protein [Oscillospiraceae bacterium]
MAAFFIPGEKKIRPGVYDRYENYGTPPTAGAADGVCAAVLRSNWGATGQAILLESYADIAKYYGDGGTTAVPMEQFKGGARTVYAVRAGSGGTAGTYSIADTDVVAVATLTMKYPGSREFSVTIRPTIEDPNTFELLILDGTTQLERLLFSNTNVDTLLNAYTAAGSNYYTLTKLTDSTNAIATIDQAAITPGTDPTVDTAAYSAALDILEAYRWNVLSIDTNDVPTQLLMQQYLDRIYQDGKFVMGVVGEPAGVTFETRLQHASAFNDYKVVYVGNGFIDASGASYDGYLAAARIAGLIAGTPSNESITRLAISGAVSLTEPLTNNQYERAIKGGMLTFSVSAANTVWVEQGINTLVLPGTTEDEGWKKIKRVKVRFEIMQRINDTVDPLVGRINNDPDGRMNIIQVSNAVCTAMAAE